MNAAPVRRGARLVPAQPAQQLRHRGIRGRFAAEQIVGKQRIGQLQQLLERRPELYPHFMQLLCRRLRQSFNMLEDSALLPLPARLAKRLLMHAQYYGELGPAGERMSIQLSQETLGLMLNSSRQSINRLLKQFEQAGWVSTHYSQIVILDEEALTRVATGTSTAQ